MNVLGRIHETHIYGRRIRRLSELLSQLIPSGCRLLDVGCGDGRLARSLLEKRPDLQIEGVDVLLRNQTWLPVKPFDGANLPYPASSFDGVMMIDVLHHTGDPLPLLKEAVRVSRRWLVVKDHVLSGPAATLRLRLMDYVGNARHRVALPYNYLSQREWNELHRALDLKVAREVKQLGLYPGPIDYIFGADLHFIALLDHADRQNGT